MQALWRGLCGLLVGLALSQTASAQTAVDGETIKLNSVTYRLWGIDVPESKQWCGDYPAGALAAAMLSKLMNGKIVICEARGVDRDGRMIGLCRANGNDLSAAMVQRGMAWALTQYSHDYVEAETKARAQELGIHSFGCERTRDWRAQQRSDK